MMLPDTQYQDFEKLVSTCCRFLDQYATEKLFGRSVMKRFRVEKGQKLSFDSIISKCGYKNDPKGFLSAVISRICENKNPSVINNKQLPLMFALFLLENLMSQNRFSDIHRADEIYQKMFLSFETAPGIEDVIEKFPVRISDHAARQSMLSKRVSNQYLPCIRELDDQGHKLTFDGHFKNGILEQMYENRVIFLLDMQCPVYCRFCFRKHKDNRREKTPTVTDVQKALEHVQHHKTIREILITGGEPLMNRKNLDAALEGLLNVDHITHVRIATRSISYYPHLFLKNDSSLIQQLLSMNAKYQVKGKQLEIGIHFVHPDEISIQSLEIISLLIKSGIPVYLQTPYLGGINTDGKSLAKLFTLLRQTGVKIYYVFTPCHTIYGTRHFWTPISISLEARKYLRDNLSDRCMPKWCTATAIGKIEWQTSGWAVEKDRKNPDYTWIRTPYTRKYFASFMDNLDQMPDFRENAQGTLDARFLLDMGSPELYGDPLIGYEKRSSAVSNSKEKIQAACEKLVADPALNPSVTTVPEQISRTHKTVVEISADAGNDAFEYILENPDITDVIVFWNLEDDFKQIIYVVSAIREIDHIVSIRIRSAHMVKKPEWFSEKRINEICQWADFRIEHPLRLELETWFISPDQITDDHRQVSKSFLAKGINVYANVPMISGVNDAPETVVEIADKLRQAGMEFHHFYAAGVDIQNELGMILDPEKIIQIASIVRLKCSGRQIPLYMIQTPEGFKDFGLF